MNLHIWLASKMTRENLSAAIGTKFWNKKILHIYCQLCIIRRPVYVNHVDPCYPDMEKYKLWNPTASQFDESHERAWCLRLCRHAYIMHATQSNVNFHSMWICRVYKDRFTVFSHLVLMSFVFPLCLNYSKLLENTRHYTSDRDTTSWFCKKVVVVIRFWY
jgi:hypothetical protein